MRVGVVLSPTGQWDDIVRAAVRADEVGLDAVGLYDHYHSLKPEWALVTGWTAYGALAMATTRVRLVPMVLCQPHYDLGVLAKESSMLGIISGGRFELGIGAGDWPESFAHWQMPFPDRETRFGTLAERIAALRLLWTGQPVDFDGTYVRLSGACCTPVPSSPPRVMVGAGESRRLIESAVSYADEINVYPKEDLVTFAREAIARSGRPIVLSVFVHWFTAEWPTNRDALVENLSRWGSYGVERVYVNVGYDADLVERVERLGEVVGALASV